MNPFAFFLAIADKVHTALNLLDPTRTYAAADALWEGQRGAERLAEKEAEEEVAEPATPSYSPDAEVCLKHRDAGCKDCDEFDDDLWVNPRDLGLCQKCGSSYMRDLSFYDDESLCPACGDQREDARDGQDARLDHITDLLEDIRNLLQEQTSAAPSSGSNNTITVNAADGPAGSELWAHNSAGRPTSAAPASQTDAPGEASGVPEGVSTPDPDAPSGHLTVPWFDIRAAAVGIEQWIDGDPCPKHNHKAWGLITERLHTYANEVHNVHK
jgi:hypothetical protein